MTCHFCASPTCVDDCEGSKTIYDFLNDEIKELKTKKFVRFSNEECWIFQNDGEDHLESLVCPVVIDPKQLLAIITELKETKQKLFDVEMISLGKQITLDVRNRTIEDQRKMMESFAVYFEENKKWAIRNHIPTSEEIDERTRKCVIACSNLDDSQLEFAYEARNQGLFKMKKTMEEKDAEISALKNLIVNMTHHDGALEEFKPKWGPIVDAELKRD